MRRALGVRFITLLLALLFCSTTKGEVVSADLKMAEITDSELLSFLKEYIVPLAKNNHYDYTKDCITLDYGFLGLRTQTVLEILRLYQSDNIRQNY